MGDCDFKRVFGLYRPVIVNVGRLNPVKNQHLLVDAWAHSKINERYNLVLGSSLKEEFGISIIEAMVSGYLIIAPQNGGVSSYFEKGENGFLIETHSADVIKQGIESIFFTSEYNAEKLREVAGRGKRVASRTFDIRSVAKDFSQYYGELLGE